MPKDNEKIPLPDFETAGSPEIQAFAPDQMVRCEECLRANPPTRINCLYCGSVLPVTEKTANLQKPGLRRLETWEHGTNTILRPERELSADELEQAADFLKLTVDELRRIVSFGKPLPLALASSEDESALISRRLNLLGVNTFSLPDEQLHLNENRMVRIRSASVEEHRLVGYQLGSMPAVSLEFDQIVLLVVGRRLAKRVEVKERKARGAESDLVNSSEFFSDELVLDIYDGLERPSWRIEAGSFDFSFLGPQKCLVAGENLRTLIGIIRQWAPAVELDESYAVVKQMLEPIWPSRQRSEAGGWHRERPGKYSVTDVTETSNEEQFTRYSRLLYFLKLKSALPVNEK